MHDDAKKELEKILGAYDERLAEAARADAANCAAEKAFPVRYAKLRSDTIRPAVQEFADVLNRRGHEAAVREFEESTSSDTGVTFAAIALRIVPKAVAHAAAGTKKSFIEVAFSANRSERKITVSSTSTMLSSCGSVGKRGEYEIDALTTDVIEAHLFQTLREGLAEA
jgi:hypothetical protein